MIFLARPWRLAAAALLAAALYGFFGFGAHGLIPVPWDKAVHVSVAVLAVLATVWSTGASGWGACAFTLLLGALDEASQIFMPGRSADLPDFLGDTAGACLGLAVLLLWRRLRRSASCWRKPAAV